MLPLFENGIYSKPLAEACVTLSTVTPLTFVGDPQ